MEEGGQRIHLREKSEGQHLALGRSLWPLALSATRRGFTDMRDATVLAKGQKLSQEPNKKPIGCLLGACSGRQPMGYCFSLLTLCFQEAITNFNPGCDKSFAGRKNILNFSANR